MMFVVGLQGRPFVFCQHTKKNMKNRRGRCGVEVAPKDSGVEVVGVLQGIRVLTRVRLLQVA